MIILLLLFLRLFLLALDRQYAVGHLDLDVLLIDPRQVGVDFIGVVFFNVIHRRNGDPGLGRPERLDAERRPSERQPERTRGEVLARATASFGPKARAALRRRAFARTRSPSWAIAMPRSASAGASSRKATRFSAPRGSPAASARAAAVISESI